MIGLLCGLSAEADIVRGHAGFTVYCGADGGRQLIADANAGKLAGLISWGTCGALWTGLGVGDIVLATALKRQAVTQPVSSTWLNRMPDAPHVKRGPMLSLGANFSADTPEERAALFSKYAAIAIDEESITVGLEAAARDLPFLIVRSISDTAMQKLPPAALVSERSDGSTDIWKVLRSLLMSPSQDGQLVEIAAQFRTSLQSLRNYFAAAASIMASV